MSTTSLNGHDILIVNGIRRSDDPFDVAFQVQRLLTNFCSSLVVFITSKETDTNKPIIDRLKQLNGMDKQTIFIEADEKQINNEIMHAKQNAEIFHIHRYDIHDKTESSSHSKNLNFDELSDQPNIQQKISKTILLLCHAKEYNIAPCILITGDTGSGKTHTAELIASNLKSISERRGKFVAVNCGSLPKDHIDSFLFGIVGNKFTGVKESKGAIEEANNGVLFLDEIGNLPLDAQSHILTFLDKGKYRRYGDQITDRQADCIIIFGTNANLKREIVAGNFRRDLYARINSFEIQMPTLSSRITNPITGRIFLTNITSKMCEQHGGMGLTNLAMRLFENFALSFHWQNNFRDLKHFFENLAVELLWSGESKVVSAKLMMDAIQSFTLNYPTEIPNPKTEEIATNQPSQKLPIPIDGLAEHEIRTLEHLIDICAKSTNKAAAGRLFFGGKNIANHSDAITKFLKKYNLKWDSQATGHLTHISKTTPATSI